MIYITREQEEAINYLGFQGWTNKNVLVYCSGLIEDDEFPRHLHDSLNVIKKMNFDSLAIALYDSYEVEKTPEEKLVEYYKTIYYDDSNPVGQSIAFGVKKTLDILGLKVEGIN